MSPWLFAFVTTGPLAFLAGFLVRPLFSKGTPMAVYAEVAQSLTDLQSAVDQLPAKVASVAGDPNAAADKADTIAAVQHGAAAAVAAINAIGQP